MTSYWPYAVKSRIFEETFYRHALEYLQSARSEKKIIIIKTNAVSLQKRLTIIVLFEGLWSVGTRFRH